MKIKKGVTLIELVVAMGIFMVIVTIAVGAFITVSRMKALTSTMKDTQQKTRIATEMITRLSRQAEKVIVDNDKTLDLYFDLSDSPDAVRFKIENSTLNYYECPSVSAESCSDWVNAPKTDLFGGDININTASSSLSKTGSIPSLLNVQLYSETGSGDSYYSDSINIDTSVILENVK